MCANSLHTKINLSGLFNTSLCQMDEIIFSTNCIK